MCTLIVLDRVVPGCPLVVAANRDEYHARPAAPPSRVEVSQDGRVAFVAPQDLEAGGTWMGVNAKGLFVGLTNRPSSSPMSAGRSRGLLVRDLLTLPEAQAVRRNMSEPLEGNYQPFHLFFADGQQAWLTTHRPEGTGTESLAAGIHVVGNRDPDDPASQKLERIRAEVAGIDLRQGVTRLVEALCDVLRGHEGAAEPLESTCVHTPVYGTRSSSVLALAASRWRLWYADGPPCEAKYRNYTRLLDDLREAHPKH